MTRAVVKVSTVREALQAIFPYLERIFYFYAPIQGYHLYLDGQAVVSIDTENKEEILFRVSGKRNTSNLITAGIDEEFPRKIEVVKSILLIDGRTDTVKTNKISTQENDNG